MRKITKRSAAIATAAVLGIGGAGAAWAAWVNGGGGSATASASTAQAVGSTGSVTAALYPGLTTDLAVTFSNPNPYPVHITSLSSSGITVTDAEEDCSAAQSAVTVALPSASAVAALNIVVPPKSGSVNGTIPHTFSNAVSMGDSADTCQGASFGFTLVLGGKSASGSGS